ncbi:HlyD family efflux transporter periplasmic adaptor subunit [Rhodanobacter sp. Si-c]|uniref:HlyD family efflux transporter periplasmic adaptor subunit n=1 Tax=Rhodanobacter lycopersici TaxID=3162487 RepID=A0ABV3QEK9_9GAMM
MQEHVSAPSAKPRRRKRFVVPGLMLVAALMLAWIGYWWFHGRYFQSTDDAYVGGNVTVISPRVSGYVSKICVKDNAYVHAGDALVELDPADFAARRRAADAKVDAAKAALERLDAQVQLTHADIAEATAEQQASQATLTFAAQDAARYAQLASSSAGTVQAAQQARSRHAQAEAQFHAAASALLARQRQLAVVEAQVVEARAILSQARAEAHEAALDAGYTVIRAPIDGYVGDRSAHVGTFVGAGTQLMSLVPARGLWVDANFKEDQLARMRRGQAVSIVADVDSGEKISGHVVSLSPASGSVFSLIPAQNATGNFTKIVQRVPVRIALDGRFADVGVLRPGLSVTATVDTQVQER